MLVWKKLGVSSLVVVALLLSAVAYAGNFNGVGDNETDLFGYYYAITGGQFPTGTTPNGDNASGGTFRYITDDPAWGASIDVWHKDDWFTQNAGIALTLKNGAGTVYDNNGIENGTYGNYYDATAQGVQSASCPGLYRGYSMSNNWDWIYAGYFKLEQATTLDTLTGYFDENSGFDRNSPLVGYRMNIWSNVVGDLLPTNTNSFNGDVFSSDSTAGAFYFSDTGVDRVFGTDYGSQHDDILRLSYQLSAPITLQAGTYWFSHDATIDPSSANFGKPASPAAVPEPSLAALLLVAGLPAFLAYRKRKRS